MGNNTLEAAVNRSGFPLQIGIADLVRKSKQYHGWDILHVEHSRKNDIAGTEGFIDLVLEDKYQTSVLVVECKHLLDSSWIFLREVSNDSKVAYTKLWVSSRAGASYKTFDWIELASDPMSAESGFCVMSGEAAKARMSLEQIASNAVDHARHTGKEAAEQLPGGPVLRWSGR